MPLRDLLLAIDDTPSGAARLALAVGLAQRHGAYLTGLCTARTAIPHIAGLATIGDADPRLVGEVLTDAGARAALSSEALRARFHAAAAHAGIGHEWRDGGTDAAGLVARLGRLADLIIVGQGGVPNAPSDSRQIAEGALLASGRPVLVVPQAGRFAHVGQRVLVAWDGSRAAARAAQDALPILERAESVTVLAIDRPRAPAVDTDAPASALLRHLGRHGVVARAARTIAEGIGAGEALLSYAFDCDADLLVMGGYGHSRAREALLGGVTRTCLRGMTVPVLLSH